MYARCITSIPIMHLLTSHFQKILTLFSESHRQVLQKVSDMISHQLTPAIRRIKTSNLAFSQRDNESNHSLQARLHALSSAF